MSLFEICEWQKVWTQDADITLLKPPKGTEHVFFFFLNILYCKGVDRLQWLLLMCTKIADGATNCSRMVIFLQKRNYVWCHCGQCLWVSLTCQENKYLGMRHHFWGCKRCPLCGVLVHERVHLLFISVSQHKCGRLVSFKLIPYFFAFTFGWTRAF